MRITIIADTRKTMHTAGTNASATGALLVALLAASINAGLRAADLTVSNALAQVRELSRQSYSSSYMYLTNREANFERFRVVLADLAASPAARAATPQEELLLRVAQAAGANPSRIDQLLQTYEDAWFPGDRAPSPRPFDPLHLSEAYRPAWEALLLAPKCLRLMLVRPAEALFLTGNTSSIPVLELAFSFTCQADVGDPISSSRPVAMAQSRIVGALVRFPSEEALQAVLRCFQRAEAAAPTTGRPHRKYLDKDLVAEALGSLAQLRGPEKAKWQRILSPFPRDGLLPNQREFLDRAARQVAAQNE